MDEPDDYKPLTAFAPDFAKLREVRFATEATLAALVEIAGLDPSGDFRHADLRGFDWRGASVEGLDLEGAKLDSLPFQPTDLEAEQQSEHAQDLNDQDADNFFLFEPDIVARLHDREYFVKSISQFYDSLAQRFGCIVQISATRLIEVHDHWLSAISRLLQFGVDSGEPGGVDHYRAAGTLAFWLNQLSPINEIWVASPDGKVALSDAQKPTDKQLKFVRYRDELSALLSGFYVAYATEVATRKRKTQEIGLSNETIGISSLPSQFFNEYPQMLKSRSISAEGFYLLYSSMFSVVEWEIRDNGPGLGVR